MSTPLRPRTTTAFFMQSAISFGVSLTVTITGIGYLHNSRWVRAFLALGLLYVVTSSFTLAKCIRDRQLTGRIPAHAGDPAWPFPGHPAGLSSSAGRHPAHPASTSTP